MVQRRVAVALPEVLLLICQPRKKPLPESLADVPLADVMMMPFCWSTRSAGDIAAVHTLVACDAVVVRGVTGKDRGSSA